MFHIYRRIYLAVVHRRDISVSHIQTHIPRRCTSARYQSFLYTDAPNSPLYIGEISVFVIYRRIYLAVVHRRDISLRYIQTHIPRRCTSARYQSFLYTDACTSSLYIGETSVFLIYRRIYLVVQRISATPSQGLLAFQYGSGSGEYRLLPSNHSRLRISGTRLRISVQLTETTSTDEKSSWKNSRKTPKHLSHPHTYTSKV